MHVEAILSQVMLDKKIGILVVDPTMSIAGTVRRVLMDAGYSSIFIAHSVQDAFNTLGNNAVAWIIVSPLNEERLNQWHCLRLPLEVQAFGHIFVSVLVNPDELQNYEDYFAFGALSIHSRNMTYNTMQIEINQLFERLRQTKTVSEAIAIDLRERHIAAENWSKLEQFEVFVAQKVDTSGKQMLRLIAARFKNGSKLEAMLDIKDVLLRFPELLPDVKALSQQYLGTADVQTFRGQFPLATVLILDPDASQQQFLRTVLTEMGAESIVTCETLEEACKALHLGQIYDLIVTEWRVKKVEGHAFIQHVRQHGHESQPVLIYSSLVKPEDMALIDEIRGVFIINKPSSQKPFRLALTDILERWHFPQEAGDLESKIVNSAIAGKMSQAKKLNLGFQSNLKDERQRKDFINATIAFHEGEFQIAKDMILASARLGAPKAKEISLLGRVLLRLGDPATALKFLEQANQMVPGNIERLCNLADASAEVGKPERGLQLAKEARKIGGDIGMVQSVFAKHAVANGQLAEATELLESEATARDMIGFMNNLGIAKAAAQQWDECDASYREALKALNGRHPMLGALVAYNAGLSLVRQNRLGDALPLLKLAEVHAEPTLKRKASDLRDRAEKAIASKQALILKEIVREVGSPKTAGAVSPLESYQTRVKADIHGLFSVIEPLCKVADMDLVSELPKNVTRRDSAAS